MHETHAHIDAIIRGRDQHNGGIHRDSGQCHHPIQCEQAHRVLRHNETQHDARKGEGHSCQNHQWLPVTAELSAQNQVHQTDTHQEQHRNGIQALLDIIQLTREIKINRGVLLLKLLPLLQHIFIGLNGIHTSRAKIGL